METDNHMFDMASSSMYYVVLIDVKWFMKDRDKVIDGVSCPPDLSIHEPRIEDEFVSEIEAKNRADELNSMNDNDEVVDVCLQNGNHYKGKRHYYSYYRGY